MAKKDKVYMPSGAGGLLRFGEEGEERFKLKPEWVIYVVVALVVVGIAGNPVRVQRHQMVNGRFKGAAV
ncbi:MAG: preprotein translocase subunit Sec61beta, partial [Candidatus Aenigmarchaeota archaeon]|nr:preprotein translocase subunit Sec61beta [Candidatus Aenigmarchaeota archaeon]